MSPPDFDQLCDELSRLNAGADSHPAELHGLACGILAAGYELQPGQWLGELANYTQQPQLASESLPLMALFSTSQEQLQEGDFTFQLCLPDDELYGLAERSESLARWCQGFLHGFGTLQQSLADEDQDLLRDLTEISRLAFSQDNPEESDEDEQEGYYTELTEFVRMAAISLFMDYSRPRDKNPGSPFSLQ